MSKGAIEQLGQAINAIADIDLDTLAADELDSLVIGLQRAKHRLDGVATGPLARWDATSA